MSSSEGITRNSGNKKQHNVHTNIDTKHVVTLALEEPQTAEWRMNRFCLKRILLLNDESLIILNRSFRKETVLDSSKTVNWYSGLIGNMRVCSGTKYSYISILLHEPAVLLVDRPCTSSICIVIGLLKRLRQTMILSISNILTFGSRDIKTNEGCPRTYLQPNNQNVIPKIILKCHWRSTFV